VAVRIGRQVLRDRRLVALAVVAPLVIMSILSAILGSDAPPPRVALIAEGTIDLFIAPVRDHLAESDFELVDLPREQADSALHLGTVDAVIRFPAGFLESRAAFEAGRIEIRVVGTDPPRIAEVMKTLRESMAGLLQEMPVLLPLECPAACADPAATPPPDIELVELLGEREDSDWYIPAVAPLVVFFFGYLMTAMSFLRDRTQGTLERVFATPLRPIELTLGYFGGFLTVALVQAGLVLTFMVWGIGVANAGSWFALGLVLLLTAIAAEGLGVFLSTLARTEFQVVQFIPVVVLPQVFLSGMFWPLDHLPPFLAALARALPLTWATEAVRAIMLRGDDAAAIWPMIAVAGFAAGSAALAAAAMSRRRNW
jgi:ABC-2 type transport system permease protein